MRLRRYPVALNGNRLAEDEFGYVLKSGAAYVPEGVEEIVLPCAGGRRAACVLRVTLGPADEAERRWHWDGNMDEPTLTPSIGCDQRCGWHGHLIKGELTPPTAKESPK